MKRVYCLTLLIMLLCVVGVYAGDTIIVNDLKYVTSAGRKAVLIDGSQAKDSVVIPSTLGRRNLRFTVVGIGEGAFKKNYHITSVTIPPTVESIGDSAFFDCSNFKNLTCLSKELLYLGSGAFYCSPCLAPLVEKDGRYTYWEKWLISYDWYPITHDNCYVREGTIGIVRGDVYMHADTLFLPKSLRYIRPDMLWNRYIEVDKDNPYLHSNKGLLYADYGEEAYHDKKNLKIRGKGLLQIPRRGSNYNCGSVYLEDGVQYVVTEAIRNVRFDTLRVPEGCRVINENFYEVSNSKYIELPSTLEFFEMSEPRTSLKIVLKAKEVPENNGDSETFLKCKLVKLYVPAVAYEKYCSDETYKDKFGSLLYYSDGDVNNDGVVNSADVVAVYNYISQGEKSGISQYCADVDADGISNSADVVSIYNIITTGVVPYPK